MALKRHHQIGISIILGITVLGTLGSFFVMILENQNQQNDSQKFQAEYQQYQKDMANYQSKVDAQAAELSKTYYPQFKQYTSEVGKFDKANITKLETKDLKVGTGTQITDSTKFAAYYIGWTPDGKIFDQSISNKALKSPFAIEGLASASVIDGWKKGLVGMHIGGVRVLAIPSDQAYGTNGTNGIDPNTPIKFVVMAITEPEQIEQPKVPLDLLQQGMMQ